MARYQEKIKEAYLLIIGERKRAPVILSKLFSANTEYCSGVLYADRAMLKQQLFERNEFCCLIAIAKYNSHAEISVFVEK